MSFWKWAEICKLRYSLFTSHNASNIVTKWECHICDWRLLTILSTEHTSKIRNYAHTYTRGKYRSTFVRSQYIFLAQSHWTINRRIQHPTHTHTHNYITVRREFVASPDRHSSLPFGVHTWDSLAIHFVQEIRARNSTEKIFTVKVSDFFSPEFSAQPTGE